MGQPIEMLAYLNFEEPNLFHETDYLNHDTQSPSSDLVSTKGLTNSLIVADVFGKRHDHVVRDIDLLRENMDQVVDLKSFPNFGESDLFHETNYLNHETKRAYRMYEMDRDGFSLLAMGFTGKKALEWKLTPQF